MLGVAVAMGYLYQGPPFRLSYKGLGEPLCFVAFGPLATTAFYLTQVIRHLHVVPVTKVGRTYVGTCLRSLGSPLGASKAATWILRLEI